MSNETQEQQDRKVLSKKELLATAGQFRRRWVDHPNGGGVYVREMTAAERDRYEQWVMDVKFDDRGSFTGRPILEHARAKLCVLTMVDEANERYFADDELESLEQLGAAFVNDCFEAAQKLNGLTRQDMDELVGN